MVCHGALPLTPGNLHPQVLPYSCGRREGLARRGLEQEEGFVSFNLTGRGVSRTAAPVTINRVHSRREPGDTPRPTSGPEEVTNGQKTTLPLGPGTRAAVWVYLASL